MARLDFSEFRRPAAFSRLHTIVPTGLRLGPVAPSAKTAISQRAEAIDGVCCSAWANSGAALAAAPTSIMAGCPTMLTLSGAM